MSYDNKAKVPLHRSKHGDHSTSSAVGAAIGAVDGTIIAGAIEYGMLGVTAGLPGIAAGVGIGGVIGAIAGKKLFEPSEEELYWRENYKNRHYVKKDASYETYGPAYRHGIAAYGKYKDRKFEDIEPELSSDWAKNIGDLKFPWDDARPAVWDAFDRLKNRENDNDKS